MWAYPQLLYNFQHPSIAWTDPERPYQVEEGEVDTKRSRSFGVCFRRTFLKEQEVRMDRVRRENEERRAKLHDAVASHKGTVA